jgi:hypothetical protein
MVGSLVREGMKSIVLSPMSCLYPSTCNYFKKMPQKSAVSVSLLPAHALKLQIIAPTANCHALL